MRPGVRPRRAGASDPLLWTPLLAGAVILAGITVSCRHAPPAPSPRPEQKWRTILDGTNAAGWLMVGSGGFKPEDGALLTEGGMGLLWYSREKFGNCQIRVVFKPTAPADNSGVFIRVPTPPVDPWQAVHQGYEVQIANDGDLYHRTGCLYSFSRARAVVEAVRHQWNTMIITLDGPRTLVEFNGLLVTDYTEGDPAPSKREWHEPDRGPRPEEGYLGLQNHDSETRVYFKEVSVRPL